MLFIAEVKSITEANEEKQLRLGLGQRLPYRQILMETGDEVVGVLVPERAYSDQKWIDLCTGLGISIVWPGALRPLEQSGLRKKLG